MSLIKLFSRSVGFTAPVHDVVVLASMTGNNIGPLSRNGEHSIDEQHVAYHRSLWINIGLKDL